MSLKDKYNVNIDLNEKYSPKPKPPITDPSKTPWIRPGYGKTGDYRELPRDIRVENEIRSDYLNLLIDAKEDIKKYKTIFEAYQKGEIYENVMQVIS